MRSRALRDMDNASEPRGKVTPSSPKRGSWSLTREALDRLLGYLHPDRERAGQEYERIHYQLTCLFEWRGLSGPEDLADETINRVARRLDQGEIIQCRDPIEYFRGVAYRVFREVLKAERKAQQALQAASQVAPAPQESDTSDTDVGLGCLDRCLETLTDAQRRLVLAYYEGDGGNRIRNRRRLMEEQGLSMAGLRMKVHRLRLRLEKCVAECVER